MRADAGGALDLEIGDIENAIRDGTHGPTLAARGEGGGSAYAMMYQ